MIEPTFIRRSDEWPRFALVEEAKSRYSSFVLSPSDAEVWYRIRQVKFHDVRDLCIERHQFFGWLFTGSKRIGAFEFWTYDPNGCLSKAHFLKLMDRDNEWEREISEVLCSAWSDVGEVTVWGPILEFRAAWILPAYARGGLIASAANAIIDKEFAHCSLVIMKAYPLEYGSKAESAGHMRASLIRQRAMVRHFRRIFDVEPFPGSFGRAGWLWRLNLDYADIRPPQAMRKAKNRVRRSISL